MAISHVIGGLHTPNSSVCMPSDLYIYLTVYRNACGDRQNVSSMRGARDSSFVDPVPRFTFSTTAMASPSQFAVTFSFAVTLLLMLGGTNLLLVLKGDLETSNLMVAAYLFVLPVCLWLSRSSLANNGTKLGQD